MNERDFSLSPGFLTTMIGAGSLIIAWAFVVGWAYLRTFFELFGVNVGTLNFSTYHYLLFCFAQLVSFGWRGIWLGVLMIIVVLLIWAGALTRQKWVAVGVSVGYLLLLWAGSAAAVTDGIHMAKRDMALNSPLPEIIIEPRVDGRKYKQTLLQDVLERPDLRLLFEDQHRLLVFVPVDTRTSPAVQVDVLELDKSDVFSSLRTVSVPTT